MRSVWTALTAGLTLTLAAIAVVLSHSPISVLANNSTAAGEILATSTSGAEACQTGERLPDGTVAIRLSLGAFTGSMVKVKVLASTRVITSGERESGWDGHTVTVPVKTVSHAVSPVEVCFASPAAGGEQLTVFGSRASSSVAADARNGEALSGRLRIEYLGKGDNSWLALLPSVARHMALGRAWSGIWVVLLVAMLMLATIILASGLLVRELDE
jgi:hypothetical protein